MVRNKVDICIFCDEAPCICNAPSNKVAPKKRVKLSDLDKADKADIPDSQEGYPKKTSFADAMRAKAAEAPPPPPPKPPKPAGPQYVHRKVNVEDALFESAVRALGPLLSSVEREKYRAILTSEPTLEEKQIVWKARHDERNISG